MRQLFSFYALRHAFASAFTICMQLLVSLDIEKIKIDRYASEIKS